MEVKPKKKERSFSRGLILFGLTVLLATYLTVLATFLFAYMSEDKRIVIEINTFGEAKLEMAILVASLPVVVYTYLKTISTIYRGERAARQSGENVAHATKWQVSHNSFKYR